MSHMSSNRRAPVVARRSGSTDAQRTPAMSLTPWIALAVGLSLATPIYAQLPEMDAPADVDRGTNRDVSGRPAGAADENATGGTSDSAKRSGNSQSSRSEGRTAAEDRGSTGQPVAPGSTSDKIEGSGSIMRGAEASASGSAGEITDADKSKAQQSAFGTLKDAIGLCERLAGVEREICLRQAQENRERENAGVGATPGSGGTAVGGVTPGDGADAGMTDGGAR